MDMDSLRRLYLGTILLDLVVSLIFSFGATLIGFLFLLLKSTIWFALGYSATRPRGWGLNLLWLGHVYFTLAIPLILYQAIKLQHPQLMVIAFQAALVMLSNILLFLLSVSRRRSSPTEPV